MESKQIKTFYFPHDTSASSDPKLINLKIRFGWKALGMYWCLIEALHRGKHGELKSSMVTSMIQDFFSQEDDPSQWMAYETALYTNVLLIRITNDMTTSERVKFNLTQQTTKSEKARENILKRWHPPSVDTDVLLASNTSIVKKRIVKNSKEENSKEKNKKENNNNIITESEQLVLTLWNDFCLTHKELTKVISLTGGRRERLRTRLQEELFKNFPEILAAIDRQPFLIKGGGDDSAHKKWRVGFDWLIANDINYVKVLEEKYADKSVAKLIYRAR